MSVKYFDICDTAFKRDSDTRELSVLRVSADGKVFEDKPTTAESEKFSRNWSVSPVIYKEIAEKLALNPGLSY